VSDPQHQPQRRFYRFWHRNWQWSCITNLILIVLIALLALFIFTGCSQTRTEEQTETQKVDKITVAGSLTIPTADGPRAVPVSLTIDRTGTEQAERQAESKTGVDSEAIGRSLAAALGPVMQAAVASTGVPWAQIMGGVGTAAVAATTGYLALKKREQLRPERRKA
jgi:ABC-type uncharacterized transport system permease subunit